MAKKDRKALVETSFKPPEKDGVKQAVIPMLCVGDLMGSAVRGRRLLQFGPGKAVQFCEAIVLDGPRALLDALVNQAGNKVNLDDDDAEVVKKAAEAVKAAFAKPKAASKVKPKAKPASKPEDPPVEQPEDPSAKLAKAA